MIVRGFRIKKAFASIVEGKAYVFINQYLRGYSMTRRVIKSLSLVMTKLGSTRKQLPA